MTTPVLSDHVVSRPTPAGERLESSGSPSSPLQPKLAFTSIMLVSTLYFESGSETMSTVVDGVMVELDPTGTL